MVIGGGPGGYAAALYGAVRRAVRWRASRRTRSAAPACTGAASRPRSSSRRRRSTATSPGPRSSASRPGQPHGRLRRQPGPQAEGRRRAVEGPLRAHEEPQDRHLRGHRLARRRTARSRSRATTARPRRSQGTQRRSSPPARCPARSRASTSAAPIMTSDEVLMLDHVPKSVVVIGGGAIGCEFASTFADLGAKVTILEFLPKILPGLRHRRRQRRRAGLPEAGHHDPHRHQGDRPRAHRGRGTKVLVEDGEPVEVDAVIVSVGRRPYADLLGLTGTAVKVDRAGLRRGRRALPHRRAGRLRPRRPHRRPAAGPRRLRRGDHGRQGHPRRARRCRSCTTGCRGPSTATPRSPSPATREEAAKAAGFDVVVAQAPVPGQQPGPDHRRDRRSREGHRREEARRHGRPHPRRAHGRPVGHRAARPGLPGRELGGHRGRGGRVRPAPPDAVRAFGETVLSLTGRSLHG